MKKILLAIVFLFAYTFSVQAQVLYGMTYAGGKNGTGVILSFNTYSSSYTKVYDFDSTNGANPSSSLVRGRDGKLYGMTVNGGSGGYGVIFSFDPSTFSYTKLKDFDYTDGANPYGSLMLANDGKFYGMTVNGGSNDYGVIFSFDPSSFTYTKLMDFSIRSGANPYGSFIQASNGKLYGMTEYGGYTGPDGLSIPHGVIFSFDPATSMYTKLHELSLDAGGNPYGNFIQTKDGQLYGMTLDGGSGRRGTPVYGTIFSFDSTTGYTIPEKTFTYPDHGGPYGSLIQAKDGMLYGMTNAGGASSLGVIFSFNPTSSTYTELKNFDGTNGANPYGTLMQTGDGMLYGMTNAGGASNLGVIFSFNPTSSTYTKLKDFDGANGANPYIGSAFIEVPEAGPLPVTFRKFDGKNKGTSNQLLWEVENELNLDYYELQRGTDGRNFSDVSQIKAAGINSYTYNDNIADVVSTVYYYRLKSVDKDDHFKYSTIIKLSTDRNKIFAEVNPNPFNNKLVIHAESLIKIKATFILTDLSGRKLYKQERLLLPGTNIVEINETGRLSKGSYLLTIIESQQTRIIKVIKGN